MSAHPGVVAQLRAAGCVFAEDEAALILASAQTPADVAAMVVRRCAGEPLEHVVGWTDFCGLRIEVGPGVFVPRRRTEFLVRHAVSLADGRSGLVVLDLCCGSGALGLAVSAALEDVQLYASDVEPAAVRCASHNIGLRGNVYAGDLYASLPDSLVGRVDLVLANVPYVPTDEMRYLPTEAREHEPLVTLDGGADGLDVLRRVAAEAPRWLAPGGHLLSETSAGQVSQACDVLTAAGLVSAHVADDELDANVVVGTRRSLR